MILGRVRGTVWATRKDRRLGAAKLLVVEPYGFYGEKGRLGHLVAVDTVDAGPGDDVVICLGTPARRHMGGLNLPVEAAVLGIVDRSELSRAELEHKRPYEWPTGTAPPSLGWVA